MTYTTKLIPCILLTLITLLTQATARSWTNTKGKTIEAEFLGIEDGKVLIKRKGKTYKVPLDSLIEEDRTYAQEEAARRKEKAEEEARHFMGQEIVPGKLITFEAPLSVENQTIALKLGKGWKESFTKLYSGKWLTDISKGHEVKKIRVLLGVPKNFDPQKGCPVFVQWTSTDSKSHVRGGKGYWPTCSKKGWMLVSIEGAPDPAATWSNSVFYAGIKEFMEQLHSKYPGSKNWPVAVGGFSGGAKICQWMGGLLDGLEGVDVCGYWLGGCNEALFEYGFQDMKVKKTSYRKAKVFISSGNKDNLVNDSYRAKVKLGCNDAGFKKIRNEIYEGGHRTHFKHLESALDWFSNSTP